MKLIKQANGKANVKMSKREWMDMGKKAGWLGGDGNTPLGGERPEYVLPTVENQEMLPYPGNNMNRRTLIDIYLNHMGSEHGTWDQHHEDLTKMTNQDIHDKLVELGYKSFEVVPREPESTHIWP